MGIAVSGKAHLKGNQRTAVRLRNALSDAGTLALNFIGSPGVGKTALLEKTLEHLPAHTRAAVLTGDIQTENDSLRLRRYGYPVSQVTTSSASHLNARMVEMHLGDWIEKGLKLLLIENAGTLADPANYDLGEDARIIILSVTDGEDQPLKHPELFRKAELILFNKMDLRPQVPFDSELASENARAINPGVEIIEVSCASGAGFEHWLDWLAARTKRKQARKSVD